ncbi:Uncharacterised protein [Neisseria subflava]|nr:Uncharacterised protein [Neisseria subflava]
MPSLVTLIVFALGVVVPAAAPFVGVMVKPSLVILVVALVVVEPSDALFNVISFKPVKLSCNE